MNLASNPRIKATCLLSVGSILVEHVTPEEVGRLAAQAGVKTVVMTHLSPSSDPNDDFTRYALAAKKPFSGSVLIAKDLMKF
jgi:ribonuclease BN (tRNA processing enzyme)